MKSRLFVKTCSDHDFGPKRSAEGGAEGVRRGCGGGAEGMRRRCGEGFFNGRKCFYKMKPKVQKNMIFMDFDMFFFRKFKNNN